MTHRCCDGASGAGPPFTNGARNCFCVFLTFFAVGRVHCLLVFAFMIFGCWWWQRVASFVGWGFGGCCGGAGTPSRGGRLLGSLLSSTVFAASTCDSAVSTPVPPSQEEGDFAKPCIFARSLLARREATAVPAYSLGGLCFSSLSSVSRFDARGVG